MAFLNRGELLRFVGDAGIHVLEGKVWVTHDRDDADYFVGRGAAMDLARPGLTVVSATEPTLLELYRVDPTGVRRSIQRSSETARNRALFLAMGRGLRALFGRG
jgi:hypothetical protein